MSAGALHGGVRDQSRGWTPPSRSTPALALKQWELLRDTLTDLGHTVHVLDAGPRPARHGLRGQRRVLGRRPGLRRPLQTTRSAPPRPSPTGPSTRAGGWQFADPEHVNEGEGDFAYLPGAYGGLVLAGYGFRTDPAAHAEAQEVLGRPVISLRLVDPAFYHLDTALAALDDRHIAYYPEAFSPGLAAGPGAALPGRGDRRPGRRRGVRAQPGQRRPARDPQHRGDRDGRQGPGRRLPARCTWS